MWRSYRAGDRASPETFVLSRTNTEPVNRTVCLERGSRAGLHEAPETFVLNRTHTRVINRTREVCRGLGGARRGLAGRGAAWPGSARLGGAAWRGLAGRGAGVSGDGRPVTPVSCFWVRRVRWCVQAAFRRGYAPRSVRACALRSDCGYALRPLGRYPLHSVNGPAQRPSRRYAASCSWVLCLSCLTRTFSGCDWSPELSGATAQSGGTHQIKPERKRRATAKPDR